jgi:hypothetical protein
MKRIQFKDAVPGMAGVIETLKGTALAALEADVAMAFQRCPDLQWVRVSIHANEAYAGIWHWTVTTNAVRRIRLTEIEDVAPIDPLADEEVGALLRTALSAMCPAEIFAVAIQASPLTPWEKTFSREPMAQA